MLILSLNGSKLSDALPTFLQFVRVRGAHQTHVQCLGLEWKNIFDFLIFFREMFLGFLRNFLIGHSGVLHSFIVKYYMKNETKIAVIRLIGK